MYIDPLVVVFSVIAIVGLVIAVYCILTHSTLDELLDQVADAYAAFNNDEITDHMFSDYADCTHDTSDETLGVGGATTPPANKGATP